MKQRVEEMEMEAKKLRELQAAAEQANSMEGEDGSAMETEEEKAAADGRSIYVGNVCRQNSTLSPHFANSLKGRLQRDARGNSRPFPSVRHHQSSDYPMR